MKTPPDSALADAQGLIADLRSQLAERTAERDEALEQQTATAEVLQVINSSRGDLAPVFDAMLEKAMRLCEATIGTLWTFDADGMRAAAVRGAPPEYAEFLKQGPVPPNAVQQRFVHGEPAIQIADLAASELYRSGYPLARAAVDLGGVQTLLVVALRKDDAFLGQFSIYRKEVRPFTDKQIALLQNFAAQAVIAMENARLITETREALERQTATAEILQVISGSPTDVQPTFDAIADRAARLCEADFSAVARFEDGQLHLAATSNISAVELKATETSNLFPRPPARDFIMGRAFLDRRPVQVEDVLADPEIDQSIRSLAQSAVPFRTLLAVPILRQGEPIGAINLLRRRVEPFTERQIELVQTFADQAVIAIENVRLFNETREALEQQTATADILRVIAQSPADVQPVLEAVARAAQRFCGAEDVAIGLRDGAFWLPAAHVGPLPIPNAGERFPLARDSFQGRAMLDATTVHVPDIAALDRAEFATAHRLAERLGLKAALVAPLVRDGIAIGAINLRRTEAGAFAPPQIALLESFAAQAVIAMENARLITETREALEQQTATAEVLGVINASPGDLAPVFDAMLEKALNLCEASLGFMYRFEANAIHLLAFRGTLNAPGASLDEPIVVELNSSVGRLARGEAEFVHTLDITDDEVYRAGTPSRRKLVEVTGARTALWVALRKDGRLTGVFIVYRKEVRPFSEKQIALLQNFAAQAVIAMENARLITETREALEQQTATAEVLGVINASPGALAPVFEAMLENAMRLCNAAFGELRTYDGAQFHLAATHGVPAAYAEYYSVHDTGVYGPGTGPARVIAGEPVVHIRDLIDTDPYRSGDPDRVALVDLGGARAYVLVPLLKDAAVRGYIMIYRKEAGSFSDREIALLQNFAAQAVIAMENARLLGEIQQRQAELRVTFDNMADGVVMFDQELRLAAWNRNFQELLDLPDDFLAESHSFAEYIRYLAGRGEFGHVDPEAELARLEAQFGEHYSFNRARPDGRVIEVRHNPMPEGGFVLIYSDITERKRSEEEIRKARDAAEAALTDLKAAQGRLIQAEKMASLGQLTAGIAHEIKNPLNFVNNFASLSVELLDELKEVAEPALAALDEDRRDDLDETIGMLTGNLQKIAEHGRRADNIVKSMLEHSRGVSGERREVDLNALVDEALNLAYHGARAQDQTFNISLEREFDRAVQPIELVPQDITRVLLNLFGNGFYAAHKRANTNGDTAYRPTLMVATRESDHGVEVRVRDNGTGIPPEIRDKLFQPFFTTKPTGEGTGLGLSISYDIVTQQHGGTITVESEPESYTEFTVRLPRH